MAILLAAIVTLGSLAGQVASQVPAHGQVAAASQPARYRVGQRFGLGDWDCSVSNGRWIESVGDNGPQQQLSPRERVAIRDGMSRGTIDAPSMSPKIKPKKGYRFLGASAICRNMAKAPASRPSALLVDRNGATYEPYRGGPATIKTNPNDDASAGGIWEVKPNMAYGLLLEDEHGNKAIVMFGRIDEPIANSRRTRQR